MVSGLVIPLVLVVVLSYWFPLKISIVVVCFGIQFMCGTQLGKTLTTLGTISTKALSIFLWMLA